MGWQAWAAYEREAHARWKVLPWRERYTWRMIGGFALAAITAAILWHAIR
jgi:hypothetical protein